MSRVRDESSGEEMQGGVEARGEGGGDNECGGCKCVIIQRVTGGQDPGEPSHPGLLSIQSVTLSHSAWLQVIGVTS